MIHACIRASAGTGKTHTLLQEIFAYQHGKPTVDYQTAAQRISQSIFLTFSNSATEEIRNRIYQGLAQCNGKPVQTLTEAFLSTQVRVRVYTFHSFALEMLKLFRYPLGLAPTIDFSDEDTPLWKTCVQEYFYTHWNYVSLWERLRSGPQASPYERALFDVFFTLSQEKSMREFTNKHGQWLFFLAALGHGNKVHIESPAVQQEIQDRLKSLGIDLHTPYMQQLAVLQKQLTQATEDGTLHENIKNGLTKLRRTLQKKQEKNTAQSTQDAEKIKQQMQTLQNTEALLRHICPLLNLCSYFVEKLMLDIGNHFYIPAMMTNGLFDFDAVIYLFIKNILRNDVNGFLAQAARENYAFEHLYIDEAQDNDIMQNYLIILFGRADCPVQVTVVGDLKQSIYSWRNAYPKAFAKLLDEVKQSLHRPSRYHTLQASYRLKQDNTRRQLNHIFQQIKLQEQTARWWYAPDEDDLAAPPHMPLSADGKIIRWCLPPGGKGKALLTPEQQTFLRTFLATGHNGVLLRKEKQLTALEQLPQLLNEIHANYKTDESITSDDENDSTPKNNTLGPELDFIKILFAGLREPLSHQVPFALFWAESGKILLEQMHLPAGKDALERFATLFEHIYEQAQQHNTAACIRLIFSLLDQYNLWRFMYHSGMPYVSPAQVRRTFCHILTRAQLAEEKQTKYYGTHQDPVQDIIETGKIPLPYYSIGDDKTNCTEVLTIHKSKGLAYDKIVVVANYEADFFGKTSEDFGPRRHGEAYTYLFNVEFGHLLTQIPEIQVSYFPYLGLLPSYFLKDIRKREEKTDLWKNSLAQYEAVHHQIIQEELNLLYVALTRTRSDILMLDLSPVKENEKTLADAVFQNLEQEPETLLTQTPDKSLPTHTPPLYQADLQTVFEPMPTPRALRTHSVRSEVAYKAHRKYEHALTNLERLQHAQLGSLLHSLVQSILGTSAHADEFIKQVEQASHSELPSPLWQRALQIIAGNEQTIREKEDLFQAGYTFFNEVPIWQMQNGQLIKGAIDSLGIKGNELALIEYKVLFKSTDTQYEFAREQMQKYEYMLTALRNTDVAIHKIYFPFKDTNV